jgi:peptidyl-prolyl cis-trans isomerase SurA
MKQMRLRFFTVALFVGMILPAFAQVKQDDVLMTIGGKKITAGEFLSIYHKNNPKGDNLDKKSLEEYLNLYINFKLKVREAEDLGLDTVTAFKTELNGYREQLAKPYFTDEATIDRLVKEAYDREHWDLRASHVFLRLKPDASPADTLAAYQKIMQLRDRITKGESFEKIALESSDDPSARDRDANQQHPFIKGNHGDLGYFTVFDMVYPFETGAFSTTEGKFTMPVRTEYGYHLIKVTEKHPALGKVTVAHIFVLIPKSANGPDSAKAKRQVDSVWLKLQAGAKWDDIVKAYSDDRGSAQKGGVLPKFGVNRMVPEFIEAIYKLNKEGDYSEPIMTPYGWHIIKLVERKAPGTFDEEKNDLKQKVTKDGRSQLAKEAVYQRIRNEYGFQEFPDAKKEFYKVVTDSIFFGKWKADQAKDMVKPLFKIGNMTFKQQFFTDYLVAGQKKQDIQNIAFYVDQMYTNYVNESLIKWENAHLETKYPEFRNLLGEYRDGILLFDLTDQKVWSKAVKDTVGLKDFYERNKNNYMWEDRLVGTVYTLKDAGKVQRVKNFIKSGLSDEAILKEMNTDSVKVLTIESGKFQHKENKYADQVLWTPGISKDITDNNLTVFINVKEILKPEAKTLNEARGLITADYQNYLEKIWVDYLRQKYPVSVNKEILANIK